MIRTLLLSILLMGSSSLSEDLLGVWQYDGFEYEGHIYPNPNPDLDLRFHFHADKTVTLKWNYRNEDGFCERLALYETSADGELYQKVIWVNPQNHRSCSRDPDMQLGKETRTKFQMSNGMLRFELELNGNPFFYILKFKAELESSAGKQ